MWLTMRVLEFGEQFPVLWAGLVSRVGVSKGVNLMHLFPLDRIVPEKITLTMTCGLSASLNICQTQSSNSSGRKDLLHPILKILSSIKYHRVKTVNLRTSSN